MHRWFLSHSYANGCISDRVEVEYKWILVFDPANSQLPVPSPNAKPLPPELARKSKTTAHDPQNEIPKADDPFCDPNGRNIWAEFHTAKLLRNPSQVKIDLSKPKQLWFYLGKTSTEARAQYTEDLRKPRNNLDANFLESVRPHVLVAPPVQRQSYPASYPTGVNVHAANGAMVHARQHLQQTHQSSQLQQPRQVHSTLHMHQPQKFQQGQKSYLSQQQEQRVEKPYKYKPRVHDGYTVDPQALVSQRAFQQGPPPRGQQNPSPIESFRAPPAPMATMSSMGSGSPMAPMVPMMTSNHQRSPSYIKDFEEFQRVSFHRQLTLSRPLHAGDANEISGNANQIIGVGKNSNTNSSCSNSHNSPYKHPEHPLRI